MEVEVMPCVGCKELDTRIERSCCSYGYCQQGRIERVDIVEMYYLYFATLQAIHNIASCYQTDNDEEYEQVYVGERQYEL